MIRQTIEKEIKQENVVVANLNARKTICIGVAVGCVIVLAVGFGINFDVLPLLSMFFGGLAFLFGWYKPSGMTFERLAIKKVKTAFYKSYQRRYRTSNQYVLMINHELLRRRAADLANKPVAKQMQREEKKHAKELKKMQKTAACKPVK